jgi:hypothetical protein
MRGAAGAGSLLARPQNPRRNFIVNAFHRSDGLPVGEWWLDVDGLSPKRVQVLARLKTLGLVAACSRNMKIEEYTWLNKGPKLVAAEREAL